MSDFLIVNGVLKKYRGSGGDVVIPEGVTQIGGYAFGRSSLPSVTIPDSVTSIGHRVFDDCRSLTSMVIPDGVKKISTHAFLGCSKLRIHSVAGSYAECYAGEQGIPFVAE